MLSDECSFETDRLTIDNWRFQSAHYEWLEDRGLMVRSLLTAAVTQGLPIGWQGEYDRVRGEAWFSDRQAEGPVLVAVEPGRSEVVGLLLLFEREVGGSADVAVRVGYLLAEQAWGRGLASELVAGLVEWCQARPHIGSLHGGVDGDNKASIRVLEKNGFVRSPSRENHADELVLTLSLRQRIERA